MSRNQLMWLKRLALRETCPRRNDEGGCDAVGITTALAAGRRIDRGGRRPFVPRRPHMSAFPDRPISPPAGPRDGHRICLDSLGASLLVGYRF